MARAQTRPSEPTVEVEVAAEPQVVLEETPEETPAVDQEETPAVDQEETPTEPETVVEDNTAGYTPPPQKLRVERVTLEDGTILETYGSPE